MSIAVDTSMVVALLDADDRHHAEAAQWVAKVDDELVTTPVVIAEMDHFARAVGAAKTLYGDLSRGVYTVRWWADAMDESLAIVKKRPDLGLADASLVALAQRLKTDRIATFDLHHYRTLETRKGRPFVILPDDA